MSDAQIGIVGGVGPLAGIDLARKITSNTVAATDQDHIPLTLISIPSSIEDRTRFLLGESGINPAYAVVSIIHLLAAAGATVIGIPCNTMHAPPIFDVILGETRSSHPGIELVNMVDEVIRAIRNRYRDASGIGILTTAGGYRTALYSGALGHAGLRPVVPDAELQDRLHEAIYSREFGIKARPDRIPQRRQNSHSRLHRARLRDHRTRSMRRADRQLDRGAGPCPRRPGGAGEGEKGKR